MSMTSSAESWSWSVSSSSSSSSTVNVCISLWLGLLGLCWRLLDGFQIAWLDGTPNLCSYSCIKMNLKFWQPKSSSNSYTVPVVNGFKIVQHGILTLPVVLSKVFCWLVHAFYISLQHELFFLFPSSIFLCNQLMLWGCCPCFAWHP